MPTSDPKKAPKKPDAQKPEPQPVREPIPPKKKGELPPDIAEPVVGEPDSPETD